MPLLLTLAPRGPRAQLRLRSAGCGFFYGLLAFHLQRVDPEDSHLQAGLVGAVCAIRSLTCPLVPAGPMAWPPGQGVLPLLKHHLPADRGPAGGDDGSDAWMAADLVAPDRQRPAAARSPTPAAPRAGMTERP